MSIKEIKSGTLYKEYSLEIPYNEINKIIDSKITELLPTVSLPGFRKGKAPINIVRKKYENNVLSESLDKLVQDKMKQLLDEIFLEYGVLNANIDEVWGRVYLNKMLKTSQKFPENFKKEI